MASLFSASAPSIQAALEEALNETPKKEQPSNSSIMEPDTKPEEGDGFVESFVKGIVNLVPDALRPAQPKTKKYNVELPEVSEEEILSYVDKLDVPPLPAVQESDLAAPGSIEEKAAESASDVAKARSESGITQSRTAPASIYRIKKGDNLTKIARQNNTTVEAILALNDIDNPDLIYEGDRLVMPDEATPTSNLETKPSKDEGIMAKPEVEPAVAEVTEEEPSTTSTPDAETGTSDTGQTQAPQDGVFAAATSPLILQDPEMSFIIELESFREKPYELNSVALDPNKDHVSVNGTRSGLTVANGFDVGQHNRQTLIDMGLSADTINKLSDWIGVNPDTIIDPNTGKPAANRRRGHELMAQKFREQKNAGTLPSFTMKELEQISTGSYDVLGRQAAKRAYGDGWDDLDPDVQAVLIQDVYVRGRISGDMADRARRGLSALEVLEGMQHLNSKGQRTHLSDRKDSVRRWLRNNSMSSDTTTLSVAGSQMLANILAEDLDLNVDPIAVDNRVGPATRARINAVLEAAGKEVPPANRSGDARRRELLQEVLEDRAIARPEEVE